MTRDEKFMAACRAFCEAERAVAAYRDAAYGTSAPEETKRLSWHALARARKDRYKARRRMMYHYKKLLD